MKKFIQNIKGFFAKANVTSRFFVVWDEELETYLSMTTAWTKDEVNGVKTYDWNTWKQKGFKWKVISEHKNIDDATKACVGKNGL